MKSGNLIKTSNSHRLLLNFSGKIKLKKSNKYVALSNPSIYYTWKSIKRPYNIINLNYQLQHGIKILNYLMDHALCEILKITLNIS